LPNVALIAKLLGYQQRFEILNFHVCVLEDIWQG